MSIHPEGKSCGDLGRVLVLNDPPAGGCGTAGVRLAKAMGAAEVVGVCSSANAELVMGAGATQVVDYNDPKVGPVSYRPPRHRMQQPQGRACQTWFIQLIS